MPTILLSLPTLYDLMNLRQPQRSLPGSAYYFACLLMNETLVFTLSFHNWPFAMVYPKEDIVTLDNWTNSSTFENRYRRSSLHFRFRRARALRWYYGHWRRTRSALWCFGVLISMLILNKHISCLVSLYLKVSCNSTENQSIDQRLSQ